MITSRVLKLGLTCSISLLAVASLSACSSGGKGSFLAGSSGSGSVSALGSGETNVVGANEGASNTTMPEMVNNGPVIPNPPPGPGPGPNPGPVPVPVVLTGDGTLNRVTTVVTDLTGGVLYSAGNAVLVSPDLINGVNSLPIVGPTASGALIQASNLLTSTGEALTNNGLNGLPVVGPATSQLVATADSALNSAATVSIGGQTVIGSSAPGSSGALGVAVLGPPTTGSLASVNALTTNNQTLNATLGSGTPSAVASNGVPTALLGGQIGAAPLAGLADTTPLIGLNVGAATPTQGTLLTAAVASNNQPVSVALGGLGAQTPTPVPTPVAALPALPVLPVVTNAVAQAPVLGGLLSGLGH